LDYFIRNATAADLPEIVRVGRESLTGAHWTDQHYESLFANTSSSAPRVILVAIEQGGATIGFLAGRHISLEWELEHIVVSRTWRGKGVGASLLTELLSLAQKSVSDSVFLEVRESNSAARALYAKLGFQETGRRKGYYSNPTEDAVLYSKTLQLQETSR
jgi:[ribosomal protein S18]-alanine N-acetyltransferase